MYPLVVLLYIFHVNYALLTLNVRNQGGEILQETISSNTTDDTVTLEYQNSDGTLISQFIDYKQEVQILKTFVLGEEERGQSQFQVMCFVTHIPFDDFISSELMSKLRQKNPGNIRTAEQNLGVINKTLGVLLYVPKAYEISKHILTMCADAQDSTYTSYSDLELWSSSSGTPISQLMATVKMYRKPQEIRCSEVTNLWSACLCRLELHIPWYPCSLKFCKNSNSVASTRKCGIKSCRKGYRFSYFVKYKQLCLWDDRGGETTSA